MKSHRCEPTTASKDQDLPRQVAQIVGAEVQALKIGKI